MTTDERLGLYLWNSARGESLGTGVFARLSRLSSLSGVDQRQARDYAEQEANHAGMFRGLARRLLPFPPPLYQWELPTSPWVAFLEVATAERLSLASFRALIDLGAAIGDSELVTISRQVLSEELGHIRWGQRILSQMRKNQRYADDLRRYARLHRVAREYRRRRADCPWNG